MVGGVAFGACVVVDPAYRVSVGLGRTLGSIRSGVRIGQFCGTQGSRCSVGPLVEE